MEYPHIVRTPGTCAGLPRIDGTRISVNLIVREVVRGRMTPEEVLSLHKHLTLAQIYAALAFYFDNKEEVDAAIKEGDEIEAELREKFPPRLQQPRQLDSK
jgi:uncharacterized protein (DUF433 family)